MGVKRRTTSLGLAGLSACLLILSFPTFDLGGLAWVALVPLLIALEGKGLKETFLLCYVTGLLSFGFIFSHISFVAGVTLLDSILIYGYLALYVAIWGWGIQWIRNRTNWPVSLVAPPLWVMLEYIRSHFFFLSFPFMLLGHSQYLYTPVIQITSLTGTYGLSFLIVLVNAILAEATGHLCQSRPSLGTPFSWRRSLLVSATTGSVLLLGSVGYGFFVLSEGVDHERERIALVQANIPRSKQWKNDFQNEILAKYATLSRQATRYEPTLIVWPESAVPADVLHDVRLRKRIGSLASEIGRHLLVGSSEGGKFEKKQLVGKFFNSMVLFSPAGNIEGSYRKIGLVPFGEYTPLKGYVRWPKAIAATTGDFLPGNEFTIFNIGKSTFGAMICWEVMYPELFREFVKRGAGFMVNATNENMFGETALTYQYLAISAILAAQHRIALARVGNSGVTAFIDPFGRITKRLRSADGKELFTEGVLVGELPVSQGMTLYTRYGEVFAFLQIVICALLFFLASIRNRILVVIRKESQVDSLRLQKDLLTHQLSRPRL